MNRQVQQRPALWRCAGILLALSLSVGCKSNTLINVPSEMEGVWTNDDPRFEGRFMELSSSFVIIVTGPNDPASVQFVDKVETQVPGDFSSLTLYSTDYAEGLHYQMRLQYSPANGGELRLQNGGQVWRRGGRTAN